MLLVSPKYKIVIVVSRNPCYNNLSRFLGGGEFKFSGLRIYAPTSDLGDEEVMGTLILTASEAR